jgi:hypothetical protein
MRLALKTSKSFAIMSHPKRIKCLTRTMNKRPTFIRIQTNDAVVISLPFSDYGKEHPRMREILDECEKWEVPVLIDCAYYVIARDINFDFSKYSCIEDITFSLM